MQFRKYLITLTGSATILAVACASGNSNEISINSHIANTTDNCHRSYAFGVEEDISGVYMKFDGNGKRQAVYFDLRNSVATIRENNTGPLNIHYAGNIADPTRPAELGIQIPDQKGKYKMRVEFDYFNGEHAETAEIIDVPEFVSNCLLSQVSKLRIILLTS